MSIDAIETHQQAIDYIQKELVLPPNQSWPLLFAAVSILAPRFEIPFDFGYGVHGFYCKVGETHDRTLFEGPVEATTHLAQLFVEVLEGQEEGDGKISR